MFVSLAHAMGGVPGGGSGGDAFMQFVPLLLMLAIFYFLLIRPQQKRAKLHRAMLESLKKGDYVMTTGGLVGRIVDVDNDMLVIDLGETKVTVGRGYVSGLTEGRSGKKLDKAEKKTEKKEASEPQPVEDLKSDGKSGE